MKKEKFKPAVSPALNISPENSHPWVFQHKELLNEISTNRSWEQKKLINKLNYLTFIDGYIFALFRHKENAEYLLIKVYHQPCIKDELICRLDLRENLIDLTKYNFDYLMIDDGLTAILAPVELLSIKDNMLKVKLPDKSYLVSKRETRRYTCSGVTCEMTQGDFNAMGELVDFTPSGMGIKLGENKNMTLLNQNSSVLINFTRNGSDLFSGFCRCIRNGINSPDGRIVFAPINTQVARFPKRDVRNSREHLTPSFTINFRHPFPQENVSRDIFDISTSGFSLRDTIEEEILLPGMIIPKLSIVYAGVVRMDCSAQVVYRRENRENKTVQCGLAIADMDIRSCTYLNHILGTYLDGSARFSTEVDIDQLWEFFFDTGFIYSEKYEHLYSHRETFKETYRKLYQDNPDIARYFVYEKNGKIYGHIAMVHVYESSWLIHHFAARKMGSLLPGNAVLKQINQYIRSYNRLPSAGMNYVMTYYRPDNKVVDRIFGRFTRQIKDYKKCSLDVFSYMLFAKRSSPQKLSADWTLREINTNDLVILRKFYESSSGGLFLSALSLETSSRSMKINFAKAGFKRDYRTYCLFFKEKHITFFIVNQSDLGLNLSDLLNSIKIIVLEQNKLTWAILSAAINNLADTFAEENIPLLIYPSNYLSSQNIAEEKQYALWILDTYNAVEEYLAYMNNLLKLKPGN